MKSIRILISLLVAAVCALTMHAGDASIVAASSIFITTDSDRAVYDRFAQYLKQQYGELSYVISQNDLRLEVPLSDGKNNYSLNPYDSGNANRPLERKLSRNDAFCISHIGIALTKQRLVDGVMTYANIPLYTFPDAEIFNGPTEAEALETIYQGRLNFKTSAQGRLEDYLTHHNRYVPERASILAAAPNAAVPSMYGPSIEQRGYSRINPNTIIDGNEDNQFDLTIGSGLTAGISGAGSTGDYADTQNILVLFLRGFQVEGVANKIARSGNQIGMV